MQASNRRQAALSESQRGCAVSTHAFMKSRANTQQPTWLPNGGAGRLDGTSEPARLTEGVLFDEWQQLKITNDTPFAAARHFPQRGQQEASADSPRYFRNGILRTAPDPSGAVRRLPFQGRLGGDYAFWAAFLSAIQAR